MDIITYNFENPLPDDAFASIYSLLSSSFPPIERRTEAGQRELLSDERYQIIAALSEDKIIGFMAVWKLNDFSFVEHFAVDGALRGKGMGGKILEYAKKALPSPLILEVEPSNSSHQAERRIDFYNRHGFCLNDYEYFQPPLKKGDGIIPLRIMSSPQGLDKSAFENVKNTLYAQIYNFFE